MRPPSIPTTIPINRDDSKSTTVMKTLYNLLIEHREEGTNRVMVQLFMCLPSRKDFPEYFNVIEKPIALNKIRERIEKLQYPDEQAFMDDLKLMFDNCKYFNEETSQIYKDAQQLEELLESNKKKSNTNNNGTNSTTATTNSNTTSTTTSATTNNTNSSTNNNISSNNNITSNNNIDKKNGISQEQVMQQSDSTNNEIEHNHHNEASVDSSSNLSADLVNSTPVEKCSLNTRRGRNSDAPKRQLLTGYIIYASEIRKQVIDKNPNQNFGDISRLVGNEWKALPLDIRSKYDQRALIHNKRVRERAQRELATPDGARLSNGLISPKLTKRKLAKLAKEKMRQHHLSIAGHDDSSSMGCRRTTTDDPANSSDSPTSSSALKQHSQLHSQTLPLPQATSGKYTTAETSTQTTAIRFVEPPNKERLVYSESFRKYIETLQVPYRDLLIEETVPERTSELPTDWLGAGVGRHESPEAALWALRDFMLQDAVTMRRNLEPYL